MLSRSITKVLCLVKKVPKTLSLISTLLALLLGFLGFYLGQNLDPIDALYLTIVTISTVGYGDISGTTNSEMIFCCFMMLMGVCSFSYANGSLASII